MTVSSDPRLAAAIAADLLDRGGDLDRTSRLAAAAGVLSFPIAVGAGAGPVVAAAVAAGLVFAVAEAVLALRVAFDAALFRRLADAPDLDAFDAAMAELGLMAPGKRGRPLAARVAGARRLLTLQGLALASQLLLPVLALMDRYL